MPLIYVTGISGAGKSTVCGELQARGFAAFDSDEGGLSLWHDNDTGTAFFKKLTTAERTPEFNARHTWKLMRPRVEELAALARTQPVFLCGSAANDIEVWDLIDIPVALVLDEETLRRRILTRTTNDFGKSDHEWASILRWQRGAQENYRRIGHVLVDATRPLDEVVEAILAIALKGPPS